tara:strand:- start:3208 stop:3531 length:324 start_codon:yes stop_codon:yes gene_type:complete
MNIIPTTTLSISSTKISDCDKVATYLQNCGITCDITQNKTIMKMNGEFYSETGCRIIFSGRNKIVDKQMWSNLKDRFKLDCAHINVDGQFTGCINDYLRPSACPGMK